MISAADFDEIFPSMARRSRQSTGDALKSSGEFRIAGYEDDGVRTRDRATYGIVPSDPVSDGLAIAMIPVMAACSASTRTTSPITVGLAVCTAAFGAASTMLFFDVDAPTDGRLKQHASASPCLRSASTGSSVASRAPLIADRSRLENGKDT